MALSLLSLLKTMYVHRGVAFHPSLIPPDRWREIENFQARASDICVASAPRSGTHWLLRIVDLILGTEDPLFLSHLVFEQLLLSAVTNPDAPRRMGYQEYEDVPASDRPRVLSTHLPATHVPKSFWNTDEVKVIYVMRNPFDNIQSVFKFWTILPDLPSFSTFVRMVIDPEQANFCTWMDHIRSFWEVRDHKNLLIVYYEDLKEKFRPTVASIANFLERPLSEGQLDWVQERSSLEVMKAMQVECRPNKGTGFENVIDRGLSNVAIKEFSDEDIAFVKSHVMKKLADTDIRYVKELL